MPGRFGDIAWAMATVRAISETYGTPVDFACAAPYQSLYPLLRQQPYIANCLPLTAEAWPIQQTAPITPSRPPGAFLDYDRAFHLGARNWPTPDLPRDAYRNALLAGDWPEGVLPLDLERPWIETSGKLYTSVAIGFSDEHFELKFGLTRLLQRTTLVFWYQTLVAAESRWHTEAGVMPSDWLVSAQWMAGCTVFLGCNSALHVLACAMGKPVIMVEPNPQRHNDVFFPYGKTGRVRLVLGSDGLPTFDARHVRDAIEEGLRG